MGIFYRTGKILSAGKFRSGWHADYFDETDQEGGPSEVTFTFLCLGKTVDSYGAL